MGERDERLHFSSHSSLFSAQVSRTLKSTTASSRRVISAARRSFDFFFNRERERVVVSRRRSRREKTIFAKKRVSLPRSSKLVYTLTVSSRVDPRRLGEDRLLELGLLGDDRPGEFW